MATANYWQIVAVWSNLPDPRTAPDMSSGTISVYVTDAALRHIVDKHIAPEQEPWNDVFFRDQRKALLDWARGQLGSRPEGNFAAALEVLERQIRDSLRRPLVLLYLRRRAGQQAENIWCLVTPAGALAVLKEFPGKVSLTTMYFLRNCAHYLKEERWRAVIRFLVFLYSELREGRLYPPSPEHCKELSWKGGSERRWRIRFITLESWGFSPETPGNPWTGRLKDWEAVGPVPRKAGRYRLRRRRPEEDNSSN
jgi:hypothetical protein